MVTSDANNCRLMNCAGWLKSSVQQLPRPLERWLRIRLAISRTSARSPPWGGADDASRSICEQLRVQATHAEMEVQALETPKESFRSIALQNLASRRKSTATTNRRRSERLSAPIEPQVDVGGRNPIPAVA